MSGTTDLLRAITADQLPVLRSERYTGDEIGIHLTDLHPKDRDLLNQVYRKVREIHDVRMYMGTTPDFGIFEDLLAISQRELRVVRQLGRFSLDDSQEPNPSVGRALHDIRAGALTALVGYLDMHVEESIPFSPEVIERCVGLARDHAKLMRNCVEDIDPWIRRADERISLHSVQTDLTKWSETVFYREDRAIHVHCTDLCRGYISNRCLETSAIDRILFNLLNNAARFCSSSTIELRVESLEDRLSRWTVSNPISEAHQEWVSAEAPDLCSLFLGGTTRDGHGIGLNNCARLVQLCFGLRDLSQALQQCYLGARIEDGTFHTWFHWPLYHPKESDPVCDCARNDRSAAANSAAVE